MKRTVPFEARWLFGSAFPWRPGAVRGVGARNPRRGGTTIL